MRRETGYLKLGIFVLASVAVIIAAILVLASGTFTRASRLTMETYYDSSVEGIRSGSAVHYQGIPVGTVQEVSLTADVYERNIPFDQRRPYVLVRFSVFTKTFGGLSGDAARSLFEDWVREGLRVTRQPLGLTGDYYLELGFVSSPESTLAFDWKPRYLYLPGAPGFSGTIAGMLNEVRRTVHKLGEVDYAELSGNFEDVLRSSRDAARELRSLLQDPRLSRLLTDASRTAGGLDSIVAASRGDIIAAAGNMRRISAQVDTATSNLPAVMNSLSTALDQVALLLSYQRGDLAGAIRNLERAAHSLEILLEKADENPGLLFGQPPPQVKP